MIGSVESARRLTRFDLFHLSPKSHHLNLRSQTEGSEEELESRIRRISGDSISSGDSSSLNTQTDKRPVEIRDSIKTGLTKYSDQMGYSLSNHHQPENTTTKRSKRLMSAEYHGLLGSNCSRSSTLNLGPSPFLEPGEVLPAGSPPVFKRFNPRFKLSEDLQQKSPLSFLSRELPSIPSDLESYLSSSRSTTLGDHSNKVRFADPIEEEIHELSRDETQLRNSGCGTDRTAIVSENLKTHVVTPTMSPPRVNSNCSNTTDHEGSKTLNSTQPIIESNYSFRLEHGGSMSKQALSLDKNLSRVSAPVALKGRRSELLPSSEDDESRRFSEAICSTSDLALWKFPKVPSLRSFSSDSAQTELTPDGLTSTTTNAAAEVERKIHHSQEDDNLQAKDSHSTLRNPDINKPLIQHQKDRKRTSHMKSKSHDPKQISTSDVSQEKDLVEVKHRRKSSNSKNDSRSDQDLRRLKDRRRSAVPKLESNLIEDYSGLEPMNRSSRVDLNPNEPERGSDEGVRKSHRRSTGSQKLSTDSGERRSSRIQSKGRTNSSFRELCEAEKTRYKSKHYSVTTTGLKQSMDSAAMEELQNILRGLGDGKKNLSPIVSYSSGSYSPLAAFLGIETPPSQSKISNDEVSGEEVDTKKSGVVAIDTSGGPDLAKISEVGAQEDNCIETESSQEPVPLLRRNNPSQLANIDRDGSLKKSDRQVAENLRTIPELSTVQRFQETSQLKLITTQFTSQPSKIEDDEKEGFFLKEEEEEVMYQSSIEISNQVSTTSEVKDQSSTIVEKNSLEDLNRTLLESNSDSENISLKLENVAIPSCCSMDKRSETGSSYDKSILRSSSALIGSLGTITSEEKFDLEREKVLLRKASDVSQSNLENPFNSALEDSPTSSVTACSTPRSIEDHLSESKGVDGLRQEDHPRVDGILERRVKSHSLSAQRELRVKIPKPFSSYRTSSAGVLENCALSSTRNSNLDSITDEIDELLAEIEREEKNFSRAVLIESKKVSTSSVKEEDFEDPSCLSENLNDEEGSRKISNQQKLETEDFKDLVEPSPQQIETRVGLSSLSCLEPERAHLNFKGSRLSRLGSISEDGSSEQYPLEKKRRQSSFYMAQPRASLSSSTNLQLVEENFEDGEEPMVESFFFQGLDSSKRPEFNKTCSTPESISPTFSEKDSSKVSDEQSGEATSRFEEDNNSHETIERKDEIIDGAKDQVIRPVEFVKTVKGSFVESGEQSIEEEVSLVLKNESVRQGEGDDLDSRREGSPMLTEDKAEELREEELVMMIEDERNPEVEVKVLKPRFEYALLRFPTTILSRVLREMDYLEFHNLPQISKKLRLGLDSGEAREVVMERFLGAVGYRTITPDQSYRQQQDASWFRGKQRMMSAFDSSTVIYRQSVPGGSSSSNSTINRDHNFNCIRSSTSVMSLRRPVQSPIPITLRDLHAYYTGLEFSDQELSELAESLPKDGVEMSTFRMIRSSTRAYNKILVRVRSQPMESSDDSDQRGDVAETYHLGRRVMPIYRAEKPVILKVWVPSIEGVMSSKELVECEKELWKSEIRGFLRTGDVCWNTAIGSRENLGKVIYDGQVLRELQQLWDPTGHLPNWLNMLKFSPSFYHNVIKSSNSTPVFYLDLTDFKDQVQETLNLCQDKFEISNNKFSRRNSRFRVQRWVYRATIRIKPGMRTGLLMRGVEEELNTGDFRGSGDERGSMIDREWIHRDWTGEILIQVEGSAEKARDLLDRCEKSRIEDFVGEYEMTGFRFWNKEKRLKVLSNMKESQLSPWKIIRERSSLGRIWVQLS